MIDQGEPIQGGCLCRAVRYAASTQPFETGFCHCRMCQKGLGNLFGAWAFFKHSEFRFVSGEPNWYRSSDQAKRGFCATCGSPIAYQAYGADFIAIWLGTLNDPAAHEPQAHWWTDSKISWVDILAELPDVGAISRVEP